MPYISIIMHEFNTYPKASNIYKLLHKLIFTTNMLVYCKYIFTFAT